MRVWRCRSRTAPSVDDRRASRSPTMSSPSRHGGIGAGRRSVGHSGSGACHRRPRRSRPRSSRRGGEPLPHGVPADPGEARRPRRRRTGTRGDRERDAGGEGEHGEGDAAAEQDALDDAEAEEHAGGVERLEPVGPFDRAQRPSPASPCSGRSPVGRAAPASAARRRAVGRSEAGRRRPAVRRGRAAGGALGRLPRASAPFARRCPSAALAAPAAATAAAPTGPAPPPAPAAPDAQLRRRPAAPAAPRRHRRRPWPEASWLSRWPLDHLHGVGHHQPLLPGPDRVRPGRPGRRRPPRSAGSSRAISSGENAATPNAAAAVRRMPDGLGDRAAGVLGEHLRFGQRGDLATGAGTRPPPPRRPPGRRR